MIGHGHVIRARKNLVLSLSEDIRDKVYEYNGIILNEDMISDIIDQRLPITYAEAEAEMDDLRDELEAASQLPNVPPKPSILDELRAVLGFGKEVGLRETIQAAIERIKVKP